ncbi:progesterone receptor isoform X1 [Epinephelus fuscoguttatus]|uniref:progesterone receptor isoform X1 n=1 Tax=Epinephelus fuscoguttatus TaxID=293821 RepID=UPI0020D174B5|nr:progesterone receptor isoform X1 [Epinephelus fuscoguttatus]
MENKINGRMSTTNTSIADSTDTRVSDLIGADFINTKLQNESQSLTCLSSTVRNFGNAGAPFHGLNSSGEGAVFKDCATLDGSLAGKHFYDRSSEYLKCDGVPWEDFSKLQRTNVAESSPNVSLSSTTGACKFIKDEKEPSVIMDTRCPNFVPSSEIPALDTCCDTDRKQQRGLSDVESSSFTPAATCPRPGLEGSPNFLIDLNQSEQLPALNQVRTDSRYALSGKAVINFDTNLHAAQQVMMYKSELPRWQVQTSPAEPQYWSQCAGVTEDPFTHSSYDGIQSQTLIQRNSSPFSAFPGMPPQRQCVICGDEASGCHYGVLTCGSCKVFFKRAVEGHHSYLCAGRNDCIVDKIRRKNCPACRLRKCYQAGMMLGGRKLKRFGALKALGLAPSLMFQSHLAMSSDNQALTTMSCIPGIREVHLSHTILNILENIEPETVHSDYDASQADAPHILLSSLNRLCEKQLLWIVKWSKSLPGFRNLHINDQMTLIQYSWMNLMVFSLGWRSFQNVTSEYLYFAPDLVLSQDQMRRSPIYDLCLAIQFIPQEFANLQVTREEFLCMKAIILLNTVPLEGLKSQAAFEEMRQSYIRELTKAIHMKEKGLVASSQRFYHLTKLMDAMHDIVKKVNLFCLSTFIQADAMKVEFPEMMSEVIASQLPKVLAGMVRPLIFHAK